MDFYEKNVNFKYNRYFYNENDDLVWGTFLNQFKFNFYPNKENHKTANKWLENGHLYENDIGLFLNLSKKNNRSAAKKISQNLFSSNDIDNINQIIRSKNKPIIINNIKEIEHFQTLINYGYIINDRDIILEKKLNYKNLCIIDSKKNIKQIYIECVN